MTDYRHIEKAARRCSVSPSHISAAAHLETVLSETNVTRPRPFSIRHFEALAVETYSSRSEMGAAAAADIAEALGRRLAEQDHVRMIFAAAPSQAEMLKTLCETQGIDWSRVVAFHMDEYVGLPAGAPERFAEWLEANIFSKLAFAEVHKISPDGDIEAETRRYEALLAAAPIDFVCLGIGVNGHIAFNDPPVADFDDPRDVKVVELDEICRQQQVDDDCFARFEDVPERAVTLTIPRLLRAGRLFCVVPGAIKRDAVDKTLHGPVTTACPASILRSHPACTFYLDKESDPDA
jgi:glucosamine-6-phosphate deaminase